jgi:hypothetical protein
VVKLKGIDELNELIRQSLELDALPLALKTATDDLRTATDANLPEKIDAYREALNGAFDAVGGPEAFLRETAGRSLHFLGPLQAAVATASGAARNRGRDLRVEVRVGPAELELSAPAVFAVVRSSGRRAVLGHLPVDRLAVGVDSGPVTAKGAGFLRRDPPSAGAYLAAGVGPVEAIVALLLEANYDRLSLMGLIRAEFRPTGFQLGFGFSLDAMGGLIGVNRRANVDQLRQRLADGSAADALFVGTLANAAGIGPTLQALDALFPPASGTVVVGPTLRLGWLKVGGWSLARADVGVILELPSARIMVPGRMVIEVPGPGVPLVHMRLDLVGELDPAGRRFAADAALVDSTVLGALSIGGTAALRLYWGDPAFAVVTVGGFNPGYDPRPAVVPPQRRISLGLTNPLPVGLSLHAEGYVAAGAGTLHLGGSLSVAFVIAGTGISGGVGMDALVQLSPLWFTASVGGRVQLKAFGIKLVGVNLQGTLTGPGPLVLTARATGEILGRDVGGRVSFVLSSAPGASRDPAPTLQAAVARQLELPANVRAEDGTDSDVVLAEYPIATDAALVPPGRAIIWSQEAFPLGDPVQKADGRLLARPAIVTVGKPGSSIVRRPLPTASFLDLTDAEVLSVAQFDDRAAGIRIPPTQQEAEPATSRSTEHLSIWVPVGQRSDFVHPTYIEYAIRTVHALRAAELGPALAPGVAGAVQVTQETWAVVANGQVLQQTVGGASAHAHSNHSSGVSAMPLVAAEEAIP